MYYDSSSIVLLISQVILYWMLNCWRYTDIAYSRMTLYTRSDVVVPDDNLIYINSLISYNKHISV